MRRFFCFLLVMLILLSPCAVAEWGVWPEIDDAWIVEEDDDASVQPIDLARGVMRGMTVEEKVYQLFIVSLEDLTGEENTVQLPQENVLLHSPVGGVMLFGKNMVSEAQVKALSDGLYLDAVQAGVFFPLIAVDEEGGALSVVANKLGYPFAPAALELGKSGDTEQAYAAGARIAGYLNPLGIRMSFAPAADVYAAGAQNEARFFGKDAQTVSDLSLAMAQGMRENGVIPCFKHFPGQGGANGDLNNGKVTNRRTRFQLEQTDLSPFANAIAKDAEMIMVSHMTAPELDGKTPCSLSPAVIGELLRSRMGFQGVVVTDSLRMKAITKYYDSDEAAVMALKAGADLLLLPNNFQKAAEGVLQAIDRGELSIARINESVERIVMLKIKYGLIQ